ncbi:MAG: protease complex subunit PrcB family protein [Methanobacteriota archaeon]
MKHNTTRLFGLILIVCLLAMGGCIQENILSFETISQNSFSGHTEQRDYVINSQDAWVELWNTTMNGVTTQLPEMPVVDFTDNTVIAVFFGQHSSLGYEIQIEKIVENNTRVIVYVKESSPKPGEPAGSALTQPYHIIKTKKITKEIIFTHSS